MHNRHNITSYARPPADVSLQPTVPVSNNVIVENNYDLKDKVHELILSEIGVKWVEFARALDIKEDVLTLHMTNVHPREWKFTLVEALTKARRNDLRREVDKLFATFT
ncbi:hypothetical protein CBL_05799 [Carabus blaptoides fortunei]